MTYIRPPENEWLDISEKFEESWNVPHAIGGIDGKHIAIQCPSKSGSLYFNYKSYFSLVLLAICDARYCFSFVDIGSYGSNNDSGIFKNSKMGKLFENNKMHVPEASTKMGCKFEPLPYFLLGDEIFPLKLRLMKPYPGTLTGDQRIFNYRLSRGRRTIENRFGILVARWRIFRNAIKASVENVKRYGMCLFAQLFASDR